MMDQPHIPTEIMLKILSESIVRYDDMIDILRRNRHLSYVLHDRPFWLHVAHHLTQSDYERRWIDTLDIYGVEALIIKWQAQLTAQDGLPGCSKGAERHVPVATVIFDAYSRRDTDLIEYLDGVCYDPVPVCKALGYLGDDSVFEVIQRYPRLGVMCAEQAVIGATMSGASTMRLIEDYGDHIRNWDDILSTSIEYNNLGVYKLAKDETEMLDIRIVKPLTPRFIPQNVRLYAMVYNGWWDEMGDDLLIDIAADNVDAIASYRLERLTLCYIVSTDMIDELLRGANKINIWKSLLCTLNGTPERLALLEHFDTLHDIYYYDQNPPRLIKYTYTPIPEVVRRQVIDYVMSTQLSNNLKVDTMISLGVYDLDSISRLVTQGSRSLIIPSPYDRSDVDVGTYLTIPPVRVDSIEMLGARCTALGLSLDGECDRLIRMRYGVNEKLQLEIVSYMYNIMRYDDVLGIRLSDELIDGSLWTDYNMDTCVAIREYIDIEALILGVHTEEYLQVLVSMGIIYKIFLDGTTVDDVSTSD